MAVDNMVQSEGFVLPDHPCRDCMLKRITAEAYIKKKGLDILPENFINEMEDAIACYVNDTYKEKMTIKTMEQQYKTRLTQLLTYLTKQQDSQVFKDILDGSRSPRDIGYMNLQEFTNKYLSKYEEQNKRESVAPQPCFSITKRFKCKRCGCKEMYYYMNQTRSSDEADNMNVKCTKCPYGFRLN